MIQNVLAASANYWSGRHRELERRARAAYPEIPQGSLAAEKLNTLADAHAAAAKVFETVLGVAEYEVKP